MKKLGFIFIPILLMWFSFTGNAMAYDGIFKLSHEGNTNYFDFTMKPGDSGKLEFTLENTSGDKVENHVLIYDSMTAVNGGNIVMSPENFTADETAVWFDSNQIVLSLESGEIRQMSIGFSVPDDCSDGIYTAILGLFAYSGDSEEESERVTLRIGTSHSSTLAIVIRVGNETAGEFVLGDEIQFNTKGMGTIPYILIPVENRGNSYGFPVVSYEICSESGNMVSEGTVEMDIFYRKTESFAALPADAMANEKGEYIIKVQVCGSTGGGTEDSAEYNVKMDSGTVREVIRNQVKSNPENQNTDFIVLDRNQLIFAGGGILGALILSIVLILALRSREAK